MNTQVLKVDEEFANLIPPLTPDEYSRLEQSILDEGCREAIVVWNDIIVDGHNRYRICKAHHLPYQTVSMRFDDRNAVILWMLQNQLARRNLNDFQRVELVRKCEEAIKARARERQLAELKQNQTSVPNGQLLLDTEDTEATATHTVQVILPERENTQKQSRDELGKLAGVSGSTYEHAATVLDTAPAPVVEATRKKELSINAAYQVTKLPQEQQHEVAERIAQGESARKVVAEVRKNTPASKPTPEPSLPLIQHETISELENAPTSEPQPAPELQDEQGTYCSLCIPFIEDALNSNHLHSEGITINLHLLHGYEHSQDSGYDRLDIYDGNFSADDVAAIADTLKEHNILEFTISVPSNDIFPHLAYFQSNGFFVQKIITLRDNSQAILLRYTPQ